MLKPALLANAFMSYLHYSNTSDSISTKDIDTEFYKMDCPFGTQFICNVNINSIIFTKIIAKVIQIFLAHVSPLTKAYLKDNT